MSVQIPSLYNSEDSLEVYLNQIKKFPLLTKEEEYELTVDYYENKNVKSAQKVIVSYLRLVVKEAMTFRGYGLALADIISEGNMGLMHALKKFNPYKNYRFATYALCWIKASIREYVLKYWSIMKTNTTAAQRKLFFNLRKLKNHARNLGFDSIEQETEYIAKRLDVSEKDIVNMEMCIESGDKSLNATTFDDNPTEVIETIADDEQPEVKLLEDMDNKKKLGAVQLAMEGLEKRDREIVIDRIYNQAKLIDLSKKYGVSAERIRQIYERSITKLRNAVAV